MVPDDSGSQVSEDNLDGLQPQQAGLSRLSLNILDHYQEFVDAAPPCANFKVLLDCMHAEQKTTVCRLRSTCGSKTPVFDESIMPAGSGAPYEFDASHNPHK
jgi:hypothetical protein